jgi:hypothetical protein
MHLELMESYQALQVIFVHQNDTNDSVLGTDSTCVIVQK